MPDLSLDLETYDGLSLWRNAVDSSVLIGRLAFAVLATAVISRIINSVSDTLFFRALFHKEERQFTPSESGAAVCGR